MAKTLIKDPLNIIICGVGGQGNILASELFASTLVEKGYYVTIGETYGASQRGGGVMSHIRISAQRQYGPLISAHHADVIIGFEPIETLRVAREYSNCNTNVVFNNRPNYPLGVLSGEAIYPGIDTIQKELEKLCASVQILDGTDIAIRNGNSKAANIAMIGALTGLDVAPLNIEDFRETMVKRFGGEVYDINLKVLGEGFKAVRNRGNYGEG